MYEFFKWWLFSTEDAGAGSNPDSEKNRYDYDTLSVMKSASATGQIGSRVGHLSPGANVAGEHHTTDHLVSQESIQVVAVTSLPSSRLL